MDIASLRKYRVQINSTSEFFNNKSNGISLFDFLGTFIIGYFLQPYITYYLSIKKETYYLSLIPLGILVHMLISQTTFLGTQLSNSRINIYKVLLIINMYYLYKSL